jgi:REP-associated tyrosine transposase
MDYRRYYQAGGTYFFTAVTEGRQPLLIEHIERLRTAFRHVRQRYPFALDAIVVLPDHLHTLWRLPEGDHDHSLRWMLLKRKFSSSLQAQPSTPSQAAKREKGVWQRRFWEHAIRDEEDWRRHLDYLHYNPVKHRYADAPLAWPYSSFSRWVREGLYEPEWGASEPEEIAGMDRE